MKKARILAGILLAGMLCACGSELVTLQYKDGVFVNAGKELSYIPADVTYEPVAVGDAYAYYKSGDITLYAIGEYDPTLWLTEAYSGGATTVFYADSLTLPTLTEFGAEKITVCESENVTMGVCEITDETLIDTLVTLFTEGEAAEWPLIGATLRYDMKFSSSAWPQIYMNLIYGEFSEGNFLYERASGRCVEIGDLLDEYLHEEKSAAASAAAE